MCPTLSNPFSIVVSLACGAVMGLVHSNTQKYWFLFHKTQTTLEVIQHKTHFRKGDEIIQPFCTSLLSHKIKNTKARLIEKIDVISRAVIWKDKKVALKGFEASCRADKQLSHCSFVRMLYASLYSFCYLKSQMPKQGRKYVSASKKEGYNMFGVWGETKKLVLKLLNVIYDLVRAVVWIEVRLRSELGRKWWGLGCKQQMEVNAMS